MLRRAAKTTLGHGSGPHGGHVCPRSRPLIHLVRTAELRNQAGDVRELIDGIAVLTPEEIRQFWKASNALPLEMRAAWQLRLLTAQRATEVHDMTWGEVDLATGWWTIPAARSKNGMTHRVPLSPGALKLLKDLKVAADDRREHEEERRKRKGVGERKPDEPDYVLEGARAKKAQAAAAACFGIDDFHGHDLRRTAASLMTSSGTPRLVVSKI